MALTTTATPYSRIAQVAAFPLKQQVVIDEEAVDCPRVARG